MDLFSKLSLLNSSSTDPEIRDAFKDIAGDLFRNYHIEKSGKSYSIANIEFYFCNPKHPDIITYPRSINAGRWFFQGKEILFAKSKTMKPFLTDRTNANGSCLIVLMHSILFQQNGRRL